MLPMFLLAIHQINYSEYITSINHPIRELLAASKFSNVQFVVHNPNSNKSEIIDNMYKTVSQMLPTSCVHLNRSDTNLSFPVTRGTLILYVYLSKSPPDVRRSREIADNVSREKTRQKVLLVTILEESECDFEPVFLQMWRKQVLNVAILEVPKFEENAAITVHRYNPFTSVYDRRAYTPDIEWFPDKLRNLHGHSLRILVFPRTGKLNFTVDSRGRVARITGPDAKVFEVLIRHLNFTPDIHHIPRVETSLQDVMLTEDIDLMPLSLPIFNDKITLTEHTLPLTVENWCPVVPINYTFKVIEMRAVIGITVNSIIVSVFWAISHVLKLNRRYWQPIKIFGMMLSMSVSMKPRRAVEKMLLIAIFLASSFISTNLYADLTTSNLRGTSRTIYRDFKELDESGLTPVVLKPLFNLTFNNEDQSFVALKKKAVPTIDTVQCGHYLAKYKNVTCFMEEALANMIIYSYTRRGEKCMSVCENLCYSKPPVGYFMKKNSAFVDRVSKIAIRLQVSGIRDKWNMDYIGKFSMRKTHFIHVDDQGKTSLVRNLISIGLCGCFLSLLVFCAEIMLGRIENNEEE